MIVLFQELKLLAKNRKTNEIGIEKRFMVRIIGRQNAMVIRNRVTAGRHGVIETSDVPQGWIHRMLQQWTDKSHF